MNERHQWRWLGFAMLGVIALLCLLADFFVWWLRLQPIAIQPRGFSFVVDMWLVRLAAWGIIWSQPMILAIYLGFGKQGTVLRCAVVALVFLIAWLSNWSGYRIFYPRQKFIFIKPSEITCFLVIVISGCVLPLWGSRIFRGWRLGRQEDVATADEALKPILKHETLVESLMLAVIVTVGVFGPSFVFSFGGEDPAIILFCITALVATIIFAPAVFLSLRLKKLAVVSAALLGMVVGVPAAFFGLVLGVFSLAGSPAQSDEFYEPIAITLFAAATLAAALFAIRLAGYQLQQRPFEQEAIAKTKTPVDPFSD